MDKCHKKKNKTTTKKHTFHLWLSNKHFSSLIRQECFTGIMVVGGPFPNSLLLKDYSDKLESSDYDGMNLALPNTSVTVLNMRIF